jgi:uncharacterized protein (DUF433 family)
MATTEGSVRFDVPLYSVSDAARHIDVPRSTFDTWVRGYSRRPEGRSPVIGAPVVTFIPDHRGPTVPFVGLAEGFVLAAFREAGVPLQRIRPAITRLQEELGIAHVLASRSLYTDGAEVLYDYAARRDEGELLDLVVVRTKQHQFSDVVKDYLRRITYGSDGWASQVRLPTYGTAEVVVDPGVAFGLPLVAHGGARVEDLVDRFLAGDTISDIADDFDVPLDQVEDVIRVATRTAA